MARPPHAPPSESRRRRYDGRRVVASLLLGVGVGLLIALFLYRVIQNTPVSLPPRRVFWLFLLSAANGGLFGFAIESVRQLQASSPDPAYHRSRHRFRRR